MPAFVNSSVGSLAGTSELDGTIACPFLRKNSRKLARISELVIILNLASRFIGSPARKPRRSSRGKCRSQGLARGSERIVFHPSLFVLRRRDGAERCRRARNRKLEM